MNRLSRALKGFIKGFMNESIEFTPKEKFQISPYKDPDAVFSRSLNRSLQYLLPSLGLVAYSMVSGDRAYEIFGYAILLFRAIVQLSLTKRGVRTMASIIEKFEAQLKNK